MPEVEAVGWADIEVAVAHFAERVAVARELLNVELELCGRSLAVNLLAGTSLSAIPCCGKLDRIGGAQCPWRMRPLSVSTSGWQFNKQARYSNLQVDPGD